MPEHQSEERWTMRKITYTERLRYAFDQTIARGAVALAGWLSIISLAIVLLFTLLMVLAADLLGDPMLESGSLESYFWLNLGTVITPWLLNEGSLLFRILNLLVTLAGLLIVSFVVGIALTVIDERLQQLRRGRSLVLENNHVVILGWTPQIFPIVGELVLANSNQKRSAIVVLGNADKVEMEETLRDRIGDFKTTKLVVRSGVVDDRTDLALVNPQDARAIIVLPPQEPNPDIGVIKTLLALMNLPENSQPRFHVVTSLDSPHNQVVVEMIGRGVVSAVPNDEIIAQLTVQTSIQAGLSLVYMELLNFEGDEIYFKSEPALYGTTFGDALFRYKNSALIGLHLADGRTLLNPPADRTIEPNDTLIVISADDDTITLSPPTSIDPTAILNLPAHPAAQQRHVLILGWNPRLPQILCQLDHYVAAGSQVTIVKDPPHQQNQLPQLSYTNLTITLQEGEPTERSLLESLELSRFSEIVVLSDHTLLDAGTADARTLLTLLHLRTLCAQLEWRPSITSEIADTRNRELAAVAQADDFIVSQQLVSLLIAQICENRHLHAVFAELFNPTGVEIYLKPVSDYVKTDRPVTFATLVEAARQRGEIAFGHRLMRFSTDPTLHYGVQLNVPKTEQTHYRPQDRIILLSNR